MRYLILLALLLSGCAWKTYDPQNHGMTGRPSPLPGPTMEYPQFEKLALARALGQFSLRILDQDEESCVLWRTDGKQASFRFRAVFTGQPGDLARVDELLLTGPWEEPVWNPQQVEPRLRSQAQVDALKGHLQGAHVPEDQWPFLDEAVPGGLYAFYVLEPSRYVVTAGMLKRAKVKSPLAGALANLERRLGPPTVARGNFDATHATRMLDGPHSALRVLSPEVARTLGADLKGDLLVGLPTAQRVLAVEEGPEARAWLAQETQLRSQGPDGLSAHLYHLRKATGRLEP